jgi:hypothetical protein
MICKSCSKLSFLKSESNCKKCGSKLEYKLYVLCEDCSKEKCCVCLKNMTISKNLRCKAC